MDSGMHMHEGIGRAGYRLLAAVFLAVGLLGAALAWYGTTQPGTIVTVLGLLLAGVALTLLFVQAVLLPGAAGPRAPAKPASLEAAPLPRPRAPEADVGFDFQDTLPVARAAPEQLVVPPAFQAGIPPTPGAASMPPAPEPDPMPPVVAPVQFNERDAAAWPGSRGPSSWTTEQKARQHASQRAEERRPRQEFTQRYTQRTPTVRQILTNPPAAAHAPVAPRSAATPPGAAPEGKSRGQCGQCGTILLAPTRRPLNLKCPVCQKVSRLE